MNIIPLIIQIVALVCLFFAAIGKPASPVGWGWLGLFLWLLSLMVSGVAIHQAT